jgi:DNA-nicking Smr family endonuclease
MKKLTRGSGRRRSLHPDDDHALWESVAGTVKPLQRKSRVPAAGEDKPDASASPAAMKVLARHHAPYIPTPPPAAVKVPPLANFDERHAKKIRSGRVEIERRVDLHGMRRNEAHAALRHFLLDCHAQGRRSVLVITGKGGPRRRREEEDFGSWSNDEPGVLKREVPLWLAEPELRAIVVSYTTAAVQHGGEGALYVHLRRIDRVG